MHLRFSFASHPDLSVEGEMVMFQLFFYTKISRIYCEDGRVGEEGKECGLIPEKPWKSVEEGVVGGCWSGCGEDAV